MHDALLTEQRRTNQLLEYIAQLLHSRATGVTPVPGEPEEPDSGSKSERFLV